MDERSNVEALEQHAERPGARLKVMAHEHLLAQTDRWHVEVSTDPADDPDADPLEVPADLVKDCQKQAMELLGSSWQDPLPFPGQVSAAAVQAWRDYMARVTGLPLDMDKVRGLQREQQREELHVLLRLVAYVQQENRWGHLYPQFPDWARGLHSTLELWVCLTRTGWDWPTTSRLERRFSVLVPATARHPRFYLDDVPFRILDYITRMGIQCHSGPAAWRDEMERLYTSSPITEQVLQEQVRGVVHGILQAAENRPISSREFRAKTERVDTTPRDKPPAVVTCTAQEYAPGDFVEIRAAGSLDFVPYLFRVQRRQNHVLYQLQPVQTVTDASQPGFGGAVVVHAENMRPFAGQLPAEYAFAQKPLSSTAAPRAAGPCPDCNGTGVYVGLGFHAAEVCSSCHGTKVKP